MSHSTSSSNRPRGMAPTSPGARRRGAGGFTLTEIMIALGVLVTGMSMVAAALHAGIQNHTTTVDDIVRSIVAENGLAVVKARMRHTPLDATNSLTINPRIIEDSAIPPSTNSQYVLATQDRRSPAGIDTLYGYYVMGWRAATGKNDYRFSIIPYKIVPGDESTKKPEDCKSDYVDIKLTKQVGLSVSGGTAGVPKVHKLTWRNRGDSTNFQKGAKVVVPLGTTGKYTSATVNKSVGSLSVELDKLLMSNVDVPYDPNSTYVMPPATLDITTLTIKMVPSGATGPNPLTDSPDTAAGLDLLKAYQCRTSLTPAQ